MSDTHCCPHSGFVSAESESGGVRGSLLGGGKSASGEYEGTSRAEINVGKCVSRKQNVPVSVQPTLTPPTALLPNLEGRLTER